MEEGAQAPVGGVFERLFCKGGSGIFGFHRVWRCLSAALYFIRNQSLTLQENSPVSTQSHQQGFSLKENLTKCKRRVWKEEASFESCAVPGLFASNFALFPHANGSLLAVTPQKKDLTYHTKNGRFHLSALQIYICVGEGLGFWERSCSSRAGPGTVFGTRFSLSASPLSASFFSVQALFNLVFFGLEPAGSHSQPLVKLN